MTQPKPSMKVRKTSCHLTVSRLTIYCADLSDLQHRTLSCEAEV